MQFQRSQTVSRRKFLAAATAAGAAWAAPTFVPAKALGRDGAAAANDRIVVGGIGLGRRGTYDLGCFLPESDVQFVAIADPKAGQRETIKKIVDTKYGNSDCATFADFRDLLDRQDINAVLIATGPNWHATAAMMSALAGKDVYCEKPCTRNIAQSLLLADTFRRTARVFQAGTQRRSLPHFAFAVELARTGKLGKLTAVHAHPSPWDNSVKTSGWMPAQPQPPESEIDWDLYLGPAAWRPYHPEIASRGGEFEKGGGMVGGGVLEWGSHCVDLCQWAANADNTAPIEYHPRTPDKRSTAVYASGAQLVIREDGWLPLGSCPVRFEGETGWVEAGDSGRLVVSSPALLAGKRVAEIGGYPATFHVRNFLDCVKTRGQTVANADVACNSHIACHAANIAIFLERTLKYDPVKHEFLDDDEANRMRGEALREPWRM
ncbi:MAG: Gfo/Idh/MocA family oxidoreductase [Pirellulaceae bacterium]|nr:Gfo/Idh/MocA family oxidoreductase [Pirellulaceae bacterium]